ncbi:DUF4183 domain-containing protein [Ureibacillus thermophilus]|mgnify:CR=1 FL=1|jgi:hypothetical protein|uniref:DUF4183 domain-containing protein n=3 Tax=Bacillati TaxID=1783272 RepID=A0A540UUK9_9BACL|nr:DUF4183 domain-containing protein [Ureibacillus terrenus]MED3662897.1 DUF4183 domain-containing protein [Ureibacillus terrenus]MED3764093.1 DUF4183 domain-containing protein [Ureibacillus terrenus]TQE88170.1 DUF4183 domain-containing protein [Ureibacillus terrenus]
MPLEILKLAINAATTVVTSPDVQKFFYVVDADVSGGTTLTIDADDFMDDTGATGVTLPELADENSYFIVYVNGVQVMQDLVTYNPGGSGAGSLVINVPAGSDIIANSPVVLVVTNFNPTAQTTINT